MAGFTALLILASASLQEATPAPAPPAPPSNPCQNEDVYGDFDVWVGTWNVYAPDTAEGPGAYQGLNRISKTNGGCLILEDWTGASGATGDSMNFYDPLAQAWRQIKKRQRF